MSNEAPVPEEGFYYVHSCGDAPHYAFDDWAGCDGRFVWAANAKAACASGLFFVEEPGRVVAEREERMDSHRAAVGDVLHPREGKTTEAKARAMRAVGWGEDEDSCDECSLRAFDVLDESLICGDCGYCVECAWDSDHTEDDAESDCKECMGRVTEYGDKRYRAFPGGAR